MLHTIIITILCFESVLGTRQNDSEIIKRNFVYNTYKYDTRISLMVNSSTEQILQFYEESSEWQGYPTRVHVSTNQSLTADNPLFITATQQKSVSSWELPLVVQAASWALHFTDMARTLCPHDAGPDIKSEHTPMIHVTTSSSQNVSVDIKLRRVTDFYVDIDKEVHVNATPSSPKYYFFSFDHTPWNITHKLRKYTPPRSVILMIESDDELCATVSIQNNSCPVFDNERDVLYKGYHLTMITKGGITLTQAMFPNGFYIVLIVKESDDQCTGTRQLTNYNIQRLKNFRFRVIPTISYTEYLTGALVTLALVVLVAVFVLAAMLPLSCRCSEEVVLVEEEVIVQPSTSSGGNVGATPGDAPSTLDDDQEAGEADEYEWSQSRPLTVHTLTRASPHTLARRSHRYFWGALTVGLVYALPVVQLLFTYQRMVFQTGDQDLCYYNFLCAHPLGFLSDFNHVYSNVGYVVLGAVFMAQVWHRQTRAAPRNTDMGVPQHFGLLYSMGLGLIMEGLLSASYHLCPNKMNFQFDSSFMYVIAVLVMIKLYQNRHSDIIPSAHVTFIIIALVMTLGMFGILFPSVYFSILFTVLHILTCLVLTLKIYYAGQFQMEWAALGRGGRYLRERGVSALRPAHKLRAVLLALANLANCSFAIYCAVRHNQDLARQLLAILLGNALLYTLFYVCMKLVHRERLAWYTWSHLVLAHLAWFGALALFIRSNTKWSQTPAQSRQHNAACSTLQLFDNHDLWHVASAAAIFLSFNMLLTVDDPTATVRRDLLHTF